MELRKRIEKAHSDTRLSKVLDNWRNFDWRYGAEAARSSLRRPYVFCENFLAERCSGK